MPADPQTERDDAIAIVGIGGIFAASDSPDQFWAHVLAGTDATREVPRGRWLIDPALALDPRIAQPDRVYTTRGGFVGPVRFDPTGTRLDSGLMDRLDPVYHLALVAAKQAWNDARGDVDHRRIGVVIGNIVLPTETASAWSLDVTGSAFETALGLPDRPPAVCEPLNAFPAGMPAAIIARAFGFGGVAYTLDAACASSLYALKLAVDELRSGRADAMIAGGVSRPDALYTQMGFSQLRALSPRGRAAPLDQRADGLIVGEGAGMFVLKRLVDAVGSGDHIYGVIAGIGLSNDLHGDLMAPDSEGQLRAMRAAYEQAGWTPRDVDLIECHATGTPRGDAVEVASLKALWGETGWLNREGEAPSEPRRVVNPARTEPRPPENPLNREGEAPSEPRRVVNSARTEPRPPENPLNREGEAPSEPRRVVNPARTEPRPPENPLNRESEAPSEPRRVVNPARTEPRPPENPLNREGEAPSEPRRVVNPARTEPRPPENPLNREGEAPSEPRRVVNPARTEPRPPENTASGTDSRCAIGSVKANIGHALTAAGAAGLLKLLLALKHQTLPPTANFERAPASLDLDRSPFRVLTQATPWMPRVPGQPRRAAISGFGFGGINAHVLIEEWAPAEQRRASTIRPRAAGPPAAGPQPVAIVGLAAQVGMLEGTEAFQELVFGSDGRAVHRIRSLEFPVGRFRIPPTELAEMLPQQLLMLRVAAEAVDDAGWDARLAPRTGVLIGIGLDLNTTNFYLRWSMADQARAWDRELGLDLSDEQRARWIAELREAAGPALTANRTMGSLGGVVASRIARAFRIGGPSFTVSSDETSGLQAAAIAVDWLRRGELDTAIVGAVDFAGDDRAGLARRAFEGPHSDGSDVSVCLVLKRLDDAHRDGDHVHAVIREITTVAGGRPYGPGPLGAATGLTEVVRMAVGLNDQIAPTAVHPAQFWLRNRSDGPRRATVETASLGARVGRAVLEEAPASGRLRPRLAPHPARRGVGRFVEPVAGGPVRYSSTGAPRGVAFVYPGLGNDFAGMGRELGVLWPDVLSRQDAENQSLRDQLAPEVWWNDGPSRPFVDHRAPILGQVAVGSLVTDILLGLGVVPDAAIGYSMGESSALVALRAWKDRDELMDRLKRSPLFATDLSGSYDAARRAWGIAPGQPVPWVAGIVPRASDDVRAAIAACGEGRVHVLIRNAADETVIGGDRACVDRVALALRCAFLELPAVSTVHCEIGRVVESDYRALHDIDTAAPSGIAFYSGVSGRRYAVDRQTAADAITSQASQPIDFQKTIETAYADGIGLFIEVGPGSSCTRLIGRILGDRPHVAVSACRPDRDAFVAVLDVVAACMAHRVPVDLSGLYGETDRPTRIDPTPPRATVRVDVGLADVRVPPLPSRPRPPAMSIPPVTNVDQNGPMPAPGLASLTTALHDADRARSEAHRAFLRVAQGAADLISQHMALQLDLVQNVGWAKPTESQSEPVGWVKPTETSHRDPADQEPVLYDRRQCLELATGSVAAVFGPEFAEVDHFPTRVRLPDEPLMLVDRIVALEGISRSMETGRIVTEHVVQPGAWYLDGDRVAPCIAMEAGQADLVLSGYLGVDFLTRGQSVYRLLDANVTFHRGLPVVGDVLRYDIRITRFFRQGTTILFRFEYDATVGGEPLITMRDGCAGFFTAEELASGKGITASALDSRMRPRPALGRDDDLIPSSPTSLNEDAAEALRRGDLASAFGALFDPVALPDAVALPGGLMAMIRRVVSLDPAGGPSGLGFIRAEADVQPGDWYMVCHFVDDRVMPGTLMYECCLHAMRILLMRQGWVGRRDRVAFEPVPGVANRLKCRGQITESIRRITYEITIKERGYRPEPYAIADALIVADGKPIVSVTDLALQLTGTNRDELERIWGRQACRSSFRA